MAHAGQMALLVQTRCMHRMRKICFATKKLVYGACPSIHTSVASSNIPTAFSVEGTA